MQLLILFLNSTSQFFAQTKLLIVGQNPWISKTQGLSDIDFVSPPEMYLRAWRVICPAIQLLKQHIHGQAVILYTTIARYRCLNASLWCLQWSYRCFVLSDKLCHNDTSTSYLYGDVPICKSFNVLVLHSQASNTTLQLSTSPIWQIIRGKLASEIVCQ